MREFWADTLDETLQNSKRFTGNSRRHQDVSAWFSRYAGAAPTSTNQGAEHLPFQRWFHFKEAFSPKFVADSLASLPYKVRRCLDPFSGSGTTALTCRMLGVDSEGVEVNPFLADLIEAKLSTVRLARFRQGYEQLIAELKFIPEDGVVPSGMPVTMTEPGKDGRYVFSREMYKTIRAILRGSQRLSHAEARLLRVLLGSVLVENSNVTINGKGRRYRGNWQERKRTKYQLIQSLDAKVDLAIADLSLFAAAPRTHHKLHRGDARKSLQKAKKADVAIFSPPYPNSFDYTDVYNLELWMLGYLKSPIDNHFLRGSTLRSHVQIKWETSSGQAHSPALSRVKKSLAQQRGRLWNRHIPEMVGYYFDDLVRIFEELGRLLAPGHHVVIAIGDSQYAGVHIDVAKILTECVRDMGFTLSKHGSIRSMRSSSQYGGRFELAEHCLVYELSARRRDRG